MSTTLESLGAAGVAAHADALVDLLQDTVDSGASIGFLPPFPASEARRYWDTVAAALTEGSRVLLVARTDDGSIAGSGQLDLARRDNARHRAEVAKLMVHRTVRRQGIGRALMQGLEAHAKLLGRTTLVLDTRQGDPSEKLYGSLGWTRVGAIPRYAKSAVGSLDATVIYYKLLG